VSDQLFSRKSKTGKGPDIQYYLYRANQDGRPLHQTFHCIFFAGSVYQNRGKLLKGKREYGAAQNQADDEG